MQPPSVGHMGLDLGILEVGSSFVLTWLYQLFFSKPLAPLSFCIFIYKIVTSDGLPYHSLCDGYVGEPFLELLLNPPTASPQLLLPSKVP